jgi:hypothetical protein
VTDTACGLKAGGGIVCWMDPPPNQQLLQIPIADAVSLGRACALRRSGAVTCWNLFDAKTIDIPDLASTASLDRVCAARTDGTVVCSQTPWLGDQLHVVIPALNDAKQVAGSPRLGCAVRATGLVACWGDNNTHGQLGDGTFEERSTAVTVVGISDAIQVSVGDSDDHACALRKSGHVSCWGSAMGGALGNGENVTDQVGATAVALP